MELNKPKIENELKRRGWTKYTLAKQMDRKPQWVYYLLSPKHEGVTLKTVNDIARALDLDPKDLLI